MRIVPSLKSVQVSSIERGRRQRQDLAAIEAHTICEEEESRARIASIQSGAVTATAPRNRKDEEDSIGEISPAALLAASRYPGLPKVEIAWIISNKFTREIVTRFAPSTQGHPALKYVTQSRRGRISWNKPPNPEAIV